MVWGKPGENRMNEFEKRTHGVQEGRRAGFKRITIPIPTDADDHYLCAHVGRALMDLGRQLQLAARKTHEPWRFTYAWIANRCDDCKYQINLEANRYDIAMTRLKRPETRLSMNYITKELERISSSPAEVINMSGLLGRRAGEFHEQQW